GKPLEQRTRKRERIHRHVMHPLGVGEEEKGADDFFVEIHAADERGGTRVYLPIQNVLKILPRISSLSALPTTSPTPSSPPRNSPATNSGDSPSVKVWRAASAKPRARRRQSAWRALMASDQSRCVAAPPATRPTIASASASIPSPLKHEMRTPSTPRQ